MKRPPQPGLPFGTGPETPPPPRYPDAAARNRAATDFDTNLVVVAGAGTGKTSLLVERALTAIVTGVVEVDRLAAITFTERAAGELKQRIASGLDRLRRLARREEPVDERREADRVLRRLGVEGTSDTEIETVCLQAMERLDRATITTIHGFCAALLRAWPLAAGVDPDFGVDAGEQEAASREAAWDEFIGRELGPKARRSDLWQRLLAGVPLSEIDGLAAHVGGFGVPEELLDVDTSDEAGHLLAAEARRCVAAADEVLQHTTALTPKMCDRLRAMRDALAAYADSGPTAFRDELERRPDLPETKLNYSKKASTADLALARTAADGARKLVRTLSRIDDATVRLAVDVLRPFATGFRERFLSQGQVSFDGLLALTRNLLRDDRGVRRQAKDRFRLLLVDEFQDTDPLQYEIVLLLAETSTSASDDAWTARLEPGRLFVVGDPKQSIYRFRGADYRAYHAAVGRILESGGEKLDLVTNFRSVPAVLGPVNDLFCAAGGAWQPDEYQPDYTPVEAFRPDDGNTGRLELWTVRGPRTMRAGSRRRAEAAAVADEIVRGVRAGRCRYSGVTILLRVFSNLSDYLRALRERNIPFVVDGGRDFLKRPEVAQLLATLRALAQPSDPVSLLAFVRSPAGGASDEEMLRYARAGGVWRWSAEPDEREFPALARAFGLLRGLARSTRDLPADLLVRRVVAETDMLALGAAAFEGPQRVANLEKIAAAVADLARDGRLSLEEVLEALEAERLEEIKTDRPLADDAVDAVRVTTVHRMKGLENNWVFLPDLAREDGHHTDLEPRARVATLPGGRPALAVKLRDIRDTTWAWWEHENELHEEAEELRVFYVALTRAKERLVLVAGPGRGSKSQWIRAIAPWGYSDPAAPPEDGAHLCDGRVLHRCIEPEQGRRRRKREIEVEGIRDAVRSWEQALRLATEHARPPLAAPTGETEDLEPLRGAGRPGTAGFAAAARAVGIAIHRHLETWDASSAGRGDDLAALCALAAEDQGADVEQVLREATEVIAAFVGSPLADKLVRLDAIGRELPMLLRSATSSVYRGTIDLLYKDDTGAVVVADFKTDRETDARTLRDRYAGQLDVYADAVREALGLDAPPRTELWLLRSGRIVSASAVER